MNKGDTGPKVLEVQTALLVVGEKLPRYGADSSFGDETLVALHDVMRAHGRIPAATDSASDDEIEFLEALAKGLSTRTLAIPGLIDRRSYAGTTKDGGPRSWDQVRGWCLHQTACNLHASKDIARCDGIGAHYVVYPDGLVFQLHDIERVIWHGNGWNAQTIGIEIDGLFAGVEGDLRTVWDDPSTAVHETAGSVTDAQIDAVRAIIHSDREVILRHGGAPRVIVAHRQSSRDRRDDPGSKVWQRIAMPLLKELNLSDGGPGFAIADGYGGMPIPEEWDATRAGIKY